MADLPPNIQPEVQIVVTASRVAQRIDETAASVTLIEKEQLDRLGQPQIASLLRLVPSAAVSTSGPMGSITEVRIRGAEANHTLLFIDGIKANDPAESNTPRFELLNPGILSRIEVVRGPESALWGSEAIGGVIAVEGGAGAGASAFAEAGSLGFVRAGGGWGMHRSNVDLSLGAAVKGSRGINNLAGVEGGERDGFRNNALRGRLAWQPVPDLELGIAGFALRGRSEFDAYHPVTFVRADTLDETRNRLTAGRLWASYGDPGMRAARLWVSRLWSSNRNALDDTALNRTKARRDTGGVQVQTTIATGAIRHLLIGAAELERETFESRDFTGGFSNQDRSRRHVGLTAEWRAELGGTLFTDVAVRRDDFNRFADATTLRASALLKPIWPLELGISYSEGIAQPTFTEMFGFFPGGFTGNPDLRPEHSRGIELTARLRRPRFTAGVTLYRQQLRDEIVTLFFPVNTAVNSEGKSKRRGVEAELDWHASSAFNLTATYAFVDADQPGGLAGAERERRRPRHSGSVAAHGSRGAWNYGASITYNGTRLDQRDEPPYDLVRLDGYVLAGARLGYAIRPGVELFARGANLLDARYQDVVGYRTEGRGLYAGIRLGARP
jgi:vitamin B12 transporter